MHLDNSLKKQGLSFTVGLLIYPILVSIFFSFDLSSAASTSDSDTKTDQIKQIETDLSREREQYLRFGVKEKTLLAQLTDIEREVAKNRKSLEQIKAKIQQSRGELAQSKQRLGRLEESLGDVMERLGERLVAYYKYAKRGYMKLFATSKDLGQLRRRLRYLQIVMNEDQRLLRHLADVQGQIREEIAYRQGRVHIIDRMEKAKRAQLLSLKDQLDRKVILLMRIHKEREFYETAVRELQLAAENLKETLLSLDRNQEEPEKLPSGFGKWKGKLPLPFEGKIVKNNSSKGISVAHGNIYIEGDTGAEVRAVFPGRVDFSGWLKGYGQIIVINHGSRYFTISGHLSRRLKEAGEWVKTGEVIGLLGQSGTFSRPTLYFAMRRADNDLDTREWLKVD